MSLRQYAITSTRTQSCSTQMYFQIALPSPMLSDYQTWFSVSHNEFLLSWKGEIKHKNMKTTTVKIAIDLIKTWSYNSPVHVHSCSFASRLATEKRCIHACNISQTHLHAHTCEDRGAYMHAITPRCMCMHICMRTGSCMQSLPDKYTWEKKAC